MGCASLPISKGFSCLPNDCDCSRDKGKRAKTKPHCQQYCDKYCDKELTDLKQLIVFELVRRKGEFNMLDIRVLEPINKLLKENEQPPMTIDDLINWTLGNKYGRKMGAVREKTQDELIGYYCLIQNIH